MPVYEPIMPMRYAAPVFDLVREQKPDRVAEIITTSDIDAATIADPNAALTMVQFDLLLTATSDALGRVDLGFELARRVGLRSDEALGLALRHSATLDELLGLIARYWTLITTCFRITYRRAREHAEWIVRPATGMSQGTLHAMQEVFAVSFHDDYRRLVGARAELDVSLSMEAPPHLARYRALGPTHFHFGPQGLPEVRCVIPSAIADAPLEQGGCGARSAGEAALRARKRTPTPSTRCGEWVELMLREAEGMQPSRETLARLLDMAPRTLTRRLAAEGIDLRALSGAIRHARACEMLSGSLQPVTQIAYRLGYSDVSNFSHAFRRVARTSPRLYREGMRKDASG